MNTFKRNLILGYGVSLVILITSSIASYVSINSLLFSAREVNHTNAVAGKLEKVLSIMKDAESGQRGFLITGNERFLEPYRGADDAVSATQAEIKTLTSDNAEQQDDWGYLRAISSQRLDYLSFVIEIKRRNQPVGESLLSVAFIVGIARGVTVILNEGHVTDSILFQAAKLVQGMPPALFIVLLMFFFLVFSLFIQSTSGMAVLTMPVIGALALIVNIPGREIVNSYMFGMVIMSFVAPTGLILPSLALVNVSLKASIKFIFPLLMILTFLCTIFLVVGIYL